MTEGLLNVRREHSERALKARLTVPGGLVAMPAFVAQHVLTAVQVGRGCSSIVLCSRVFTVVGLVRCGARAFVCGMPALQPRMPILVTGSCARNPSRGAVGVPLWDKLPLLTCILPVCISVPSRCRSNDHPVASRLVASSGQVGYAHHCLHDDQ